MQPISGQNVAKKNSPIDVVTVKYALLRRYASASEKRK